jgi:hypothetical protein
MTREEQDDAQRQDTQEREQMLTEALVRVWNCVLPHLLDPQYYYDMRLICRECGISLKRVIGE